MNPIMLGSLVIRKSTQSKRWGLFRWAKISLGSYYRYPKCGHCIHCTGHPVYETLYGETWVAVYMGSSLQDVIDWSSTVLGLQNLEVMQ